MKQRNIEPYSHVRVTWRDSAYKEGWNYAAIVPSLTEVISVGYLVANTDEVLSLTGSVDSSGGVLNVLHIPWAVVEDVQVLKEPKGK